MAVSQMPVTHELDTARHMRALRYRIAQVSDLQRQREDLNALKDSAREPLDLAVQIAKIESALRIARLALAQSLQALPTSERLRFIKLHAQTGSGAPTVSRAQS